MPFAAALSEHPLATHAVGEVVGDVLERLGDEPDLAFLFVTPPHTGALEDVVRAVRTLLRPRLLAGCTGGTVIGGAREVEDTPAISLWAAKGLDAWGARDRLPVEDADAVVVLADPFTVDVEALITGATVPVLGGLCSAARGPGGNRLVLDDSITVDGAVAVAIRGVRVEPVVSQGCRPIGDPMVVTRGEGSLIHELAGRPALERVEETLRRLAPEELEHARAGLHVGRVVDERVAEFRRGDFLVRNLLGADRSTGAISVGHDVEIGATVQLQVRDAVTAAEDLRDQVEQRPRDAALLFTCNGRGTHLFGVPDHDASLVAGDTAGLPVAGMSCAGEVGPVGGRNFLHSFTASLLLLRDGA